MESFKRHFVDLFDLSPEIIMDLPLIMMVGQERLYLENHKGIALYQTDKIKIHLKIGYLILTGHDLAIEEIQSDHLSILGQIEGFYYEQG